MTDADVSFVLQSFTVLCENRGMYPLRSGSDTKLEKIGSLPNYFFYESAKNKKGLGKKV